MKKVRIKKKAEIGDVIITLPASKSIANRALIIDALAGGNSTIENISEARDTQTMRRLLKSGDTVLDVLDAGTTMRFLTAYLAVSVSRQGKVLTGTERMCQRPIKVLVDALQELGASISYVKNVGFPPIKIDAFDKQKVKALKVRGDMSSQYISALLMIAPTLPQGLSIELTGKIGSKPYISMTLKVMESFGVKAVWEGNVIEVPPQTYRPVDYYVEPDWSAASYWYSIAALSKGGNITLQGLKEASLQGDRVIAAIMEPLGVSTTFTSEGALLSRKDHVQRTSIDFTHCPDLAQTVAVVCAVKGITCQMTGLESLRIKETDRIAALQNELGKLGSNIVEDNGKWLLTPSHNLSEHQDITVKTYEDHRMAMAFGPLATHMDVFILDPSVVNKSYPGYWKDLQLASFNLSEG